MQIRVCPECYKAFYSSIDDNCIICPDCSHIFFERRAQERVRGQLSISLSHNGSYVLGVTTDYSSAGAGIIYKGGYLEADTLVALNMADGTRRPAKTVWVKKVSRAVVSAGLRLVEDDIKYSTHGGG